MSLRIGQGIDVHAFTDDPGRPLVLGGVTVEDSLGLAGHSDADALTHACTDAVLGAAGLGDLGDHFPDTDPQWAGADSVRLLIEVVRLVEAEGWKVVNIDATVMAERPKLGPLRARMAERLTEAVGAPVSVKATTFEKLGTLGQGAGIAALAVALLESA
ncbi:MAG TPA: 2-C-methyl-D-erythritol 2,4-cyclodiphosphate synthase [Acidimicrobiales bacterium]|nr:2-C-methyl-D-erythritol 2,4-cyclodiphosphate synthase [Acidimicrobiales bacterium]